MEIRAKPVETDDELRMAQDLMAREHANGSVALRIWLSDLSQRYPGYRREHTRIVLANGEVAAALRIITDTIVVGEARLKMGGLGWLSTADRHRRKGLHQRLMADALEYMRRNNYHVSMLFGIPDVYQRFGYVSTLPDYEVDVGTIDALGFDTSYRVQPATPSLVPVLQRMHSDVNARISCSLLRTGAHFRNRWHSWETWYALADGQGRIEGYLLAEPEADHLRVDEVGVASPDVCPAVVGAAGALASDESLGFVRFHLPPAHPLWRYLLQFRATFSMHTEYNAGGMMAFINTGETLESLVPEWESLLQTSLLREARTEFTLVVNNAAHRIRATRGAVDVAQASGANKVSLDDADLVHLVSGHRYPEDILASRRAIMTSEARRLFCLLFPKRTPYVWRFDRF